MTDLINGHSNAIQSLKHPKKHKFKGLQHQQQQVMHAISSSIYASKRQEQKGTPNKGAPLKLNYYLQHNPYTEKLKLHNQQYI